MAHSCNSNFVQLSTERIDREIRISSDWINPIMDWWWVIIADAMMFLFCFVALSEMIFFSFFFLWLIVWKDFFWLHLLLFVHILGMLSILGNLLSILFHTQTIGFQGISEVCCCRSESYILSEWLTLMDQLVFRGPSCWGILWGLHQTLYLRLSRWAVLGEWVLEPLLTVLPVGRQL